MAITVKYIGTADNYAEIAVTGKQSVWQVGQQEERSDVEAGQLLATGLFSSAPLPVMASTNLTGGLSLFAGDVAVPTSVYGQDLNLRKKQWKLLTAFNPGPTNWTISGGSKVLGAAGSNKLGGGLSSLDWTIPDTGSTLHWNIPAALKFTLADVLTVGLLFDTDTVRGSAITVTFYNTEYGIGKTLTFANAYSSPGEAVFAVAHIDRVAAESPNSSAPWSAGSGGFTNSMLINTMEVFAITSAGTTMNLKLHGIVLGGKAKTKVMIGFDMWAKDATNIYQLAYPQMAARGWCGYLAVPGADSSTVTASEFRQTDEMYANGWDIHNHSWVHKTPTMWGDDSAAMYADYKMARDYLLARGYLTAAAIAAWPQNESSVNSRQALKDLGYKWVRGLSTTYVNAYPNNITGIPNKMNSGSVDLSDRTGAGNVAMIQAAVREGQSINFFTHSIYQTGDLGAPNTTDPGTGAKMNAPFNYDIWESNWNAFFAELCVQEDAGAIEVITPSQYYSRCTGDYIAR